MGKFQLQFKANLENIESIEASGIDFRWYLKFKCANCGEEPAKWQYITLSEKTPLKGGRGDANFVSKCKLCSRENSAAILPDSIAKYTSEDSDNFKTIVVYECRGIEPTDYSLRNGFTAKASESTTEFLDVNLEEKEWFDYDEKANVSVGISEVEHRFKHER